MCWIFFFINFQRKVTLWIIIGLIFLGIVAACTMLFFHTHTKRSRIVGILCVIFGALMYASPLTIMVCVMLSAWMLDRSGFIKIRVIINTIQLTYSSPKQILILVQIQMSIHLIITITSIIIHSLIFYLTQQQVIKTKSVKYMPFYLSLANFLNGVVWVTYALIRFDLYILVNSQWINVLTSICLIIEIRMNNNNNNNNNK